MDSLLYSIGSAIGRLESVSTLRAERTGELVEVVADAGQFARLVAALGRRVEIAGRLTRDADGRAIAVAMRDLEVLPAGRPLTDLIGLDPDFTGGLTPEEYLEEIRGES